MNETVRQLTSQQTKQQTIQLTRPVQLNLPNIDPKEYTYKELLEKNPLPKTFEQAQKFFRDHTDTLIKLKEDNDFLRVVLKATNVGEDGEKHEYTVELPLDDKEGWKEQYIELAQKVYEMWLELETPKHEQ